MALDFPPSPAVNDTYTSGGRTWRWDGTSWLNVTPLDITGIAGLGTGVATALGVNIGSGGAFVVNGGALGTPSSGTVTNLTGTASININGTVGATTPSTGRFTRLGLTGSYIDLGTTQQILNFGSNLQFLSGAIYDGTDTIAKHTAASRISLISDQIFFQTNAGLTVDSPFSYTSRMIIDGNGNVGIGTTSPAAPLELVGSNGAAIFRSSAAVSANASTRLLGGAFTGNPIAIAIADGVTGLNVVSIGGGTSLAEPASAVLFYTGSAGSLATGTERMRITSAGDVGIGTTSPGYKLEVKGAGASIASNDNDVVGTRMFSSEGAGAGFLETATNHPLILRTNQAGAITISTDQAIRFNAYGAGTLTTDSSGNITATSDERAKDTIGTFSTGLAALRQLTPKKWRWKEETGLNTDDINVGIYAQDLIAAGLSEAVSTERTVQVTDEVELEGEGGVKRTERRSRVDENGKPVTQRVPAPYTVNDRAVIAALVNAVKELSERLDALAAL
jgi:hypothetical protein